MVVHMYSTKCYFGFTSITGCTSTIGINDNSNNNVTIVIGYN